MNDSSGPLEIKAQDYWNIFPAATMGERGTYRLDANYELRGRASEKENTGGTYPLRPMSSSAAHTKVGVVAVTRIERVTRGL